MDALIDKQRLNELSALALAHMGDAVYEIMVRTMLITAMDSTNAHLHEDTIRLVCAGAQAEAADLILPQLTDRELAIYKRGRNADVRNIPKNATRAQYAKATGIEALFGALYLLGETARLEQLFAIIMEDHNAT